MADTEDFIDLHQPSTLIAVDETAAHIEQPDTPPSSAMNTDENDIQEIEFNSNQF